MRRESVQPGSVKRRTLLAADATRNGHIYAVNYQTNPRAMFYNKRLLEAGGVAGPPTDAAAFEDAIVRATSRERNAFGYALATKPGDTVGMFIYLMPIVLGF